jgi:hypothetical protein
MATGAQLGKPAVNDPREFTLREVQQVVANIRERLRILDSTLSTVQTLQQVGAQTAAVDLASLQRQITNLSQALAALTAIVDGLELGGFTDPRTEQLAGELMALQLEVDNLGSPDPGRLPQLEAQVGQIQQQVDSNNCTYLI